MLALIALVSTIPVSWAQADDDIAEEIIVYADDFARWDDTRWLVQAELILPMGQTFARDINEAFVSYAFQIRAVVGCEQERRLSKRKMEVACEIEDVALLASSLRRAEGERDREMVQRVLDEVDAKMTGLRVQMQTDFKGGVTNFDLEGLDPRNERERAIQESLRQMVNRVMSGFHLRIPDHAQRAGQWVEYRSALMQLPSLTSSKGSTTLVHVVSPYGGMQLVQTVGEGTMTVNIPMVDASFGEDNSGTASGGSAGGGGFGGLSTAAPTEIGGPSVIGLARTQESSLEAIYSLEASGVGVFDKSTGIMSERVWRVQGEPTASSAGGTQTPPFRNIGRIQLLGQGDRPEVGPSMQVALPGARVEGLPNWVSIEAVPE